MSTPQGNNADFKRWIPDAARAKVEVRIKVDTSTLRAVTLFEYKDRKSVGDTGKLCVEYMEHCAKATGVPKITKIVATALVPTDKDSQSVQELKLEWVGVLLGNGFRLVKATSGPDPMDVDGNGIAEYEKTI